MLRRRGFLQGCTAALALTALQPRMLLSAPNPRTGVLVVVSLRGGWDSLSAIVPCEDPVYRVARPNLAVSGTLALNGHLGLHPALEPLQELYQAGQLAIVPSAGLTEDTRSHFQAMAWMDGGVPGRAASDGWISRWLGEMQHRESEFPALALGVPSQALQGFPRTLSMDDLEELDFQLIREDLAPRFLDEPSRHALEALQLARRVAEQKCCSDMEYPDSDFGYQLSQAAHLIRCPELGVRAVTLELEGWDTHSNQCDVFQDLLADLADSLRAFAEDVEDYPVTTVVMSEFGRTVAENASLGTDHGRGGAMLVLGDGVRGGIYGGYPALEHSEVLEVTVDYRNVLGEVLTRRMGCASLRTVFPGWSDFQPLGLTRS